jgi:hypothetical protein
MKRWINLQRVWPNYLIETDCEVCAPDFDYIDTIIHSPVLVGGIAEMFKSCSLEPSAHGESGQGHWVKGIESGQASYVADHSGIDEAKNTARCVVEVLKTGFEFK